MSRALLRSFMFLTIMAFLGPGVVWAGGPPPFYSTNGRCPQGTVCDHALGVALTPPSTWQRIPPGHFPAHTLVWFTYPNLGLDYNVRLLIGPDGVTSDRNDARAAAYAASRLVSGYRSIHPTQYTVRYGGAPGVLVRGLPGGPGPDALIILAHQSTLYNIIAPGFTLAADQRQALASLQFIQRVGSFPPVNPPTPMGPPSRRSIPGGVFGRGTLTLTPENGLHGGAHTYSLWFHSRVQQAWRLTYSVPCQGGHAQLVVDLIDPRGYVADQVLHRRGRANRVGQAEEIAGVFRLDVWSRCANWSVTASGIMP